MKFLGMAIYNVLACLPPALRAEDSQEWLSYQTVAETAVV
jgi:hypothetical protein